MLHFKSLSLKRGIFEQFVSDQQKRWTEPTSHKFEGSGSTYSLQTLQYGRFSLSEVCFAKRGVHVQNRPWGWIRQRSSAQRFTKISTTFLGRELPVSVLRRLMIRVIIYLDGLLTLWNSTRKIFMANYSVTFLLQHLDFVINLKKFVLDTTQEIELIVNYEFVITSGKDNRSMPGVV